MIYFADEPTKYKLILLYLLDALGLELTRSQFTTLSGETDLIPYFDLQNSIAELEEAGFLAAVPRTTGQYYALTEEGKATLQMFCERLPLSLRERLDECAEQNRESLRSQSHYVSLMQKLPEGGYEVSLRIMEPTRTVLAMRLLMPDSASANHVCNTWASKTQAVYQFLMQELTR